jgi:general secretion pathway protein M
MNWRERWERFSAREQRLIIVAGVVLILILLRVTIVGPFLGYRQQLADEIVQNREWLENARAYLARAGEVERNRDKLRDQVRQVRTQLVPGGTPDLAAANLQDTLHGLAGEAGIEIRSTQKMRDEPVDDFRRIAVRITVTGEIQALAEFLSGIEYNKQRFLITFFEISRRGAVLRNQGARALSATIEVSAFIQGPLEASQPAAAPEAPEASEDEPEGAA